MTVQKFPPLCDYSHFSPVNSQTRPSTYFGLIHNSCNMRFQKILKSIFRVHHLYKNFHNPHCFQQNREQHELVTLPWQLSVPNASGHWELIYGCVTVLSRTQRSSYCYLVIRHKHKGSETSQALFIDNNLQPAMNNGMLCKYSKTASINNTRSTHCAKADRIYRWQVNVLAPGFA